MFFAAAVACAGPLPFTAGPEAFDPKGGRIQGIAASEEALYILLPSMRGGVSRACHRLPQG